VAGWRILRVTAASISLVALTAACGHTTSPDAESGDNPRRAAQAESAPAFTAQNGSFSVAELPRGFSVWRATRHADGPAAGQSYDAQDFLNASAQQKFTVSVHRNIDIGIFTDPAQTLHPVPSDHKVQGRDTYSAVNELSQQREIFWVVDSTTLAYVIGNNMTDDELLAIAEGVHVDGAS